MHGGAAPARAACHGCGGWGVGLEFLDLSSRQTYRSLRIANDLQAVLFNVSDDRDGAIVMDRTIWRIVSPASSTLQLTASCSFQKAS